MDAEKGYSLHSNPFFFLIKVFLNIINEYGKTLYIYIYIYIYINELHTRKSDIPFKRQ